MLRRNIGAMKIIILTALAAILTCISPVIASGVRVQLEEFTYLVDDAGHSHPIDHTVVDVFGVEFTNQYGSVDKTSARGAYGASWFEVPAEANGHLNHDVFLYVQDGAFRAVTDAYRNENEPGAKFNLVAMTIHRDGNNVLVRSLRALDPTARVAATAFQREIQHRLDLALAAPR